MLNVINKIKDSIDDMRETLTCKQCGNEASVHSLKKSSFICPECGAYLRLNPRRRIEMTFDSFTELYPDMLSCNVIDFPGYDEKLAKAKETSGESDSVVCGKGILGGMEAMVFVMNSEFMMGSLGSVAGEKITSIFECATKEKLPVIGFTTSGGARMQEGIFSLMQMAKVSAAVKRHSDAGLLYVTVLTDPTTGGVTASYAILGDIIISEPKALVGFAGARVIEQTTNQKLPEGFQSAEFLLEHGFVDFIEKRETLKERLFQILKIHCS